MKIKKQSVAEIAKILDVECDCMLPSAFDIKKVLYEKNKSKFMQLFFKKLSTFVRNYDKIIASYYADYRC